MATNEQIKKFNDRKAKKLKKLQLLLEQTKNAEYTKREPKVKTLSASEIKTKVAEIAKQSEEFKKAKKVTIAMIAKWADEIEPMLFRIIATAKAAKENAFKKITDPKDKRQYRRLIDRVEKTNLKPRDFIPAIKAQQNRIANIESELGDIAKYLSK